MYAPYTLRKNIANVLTRESLACIFAAHAAHTEQPGERKMKDLIRIARDAWTTRSLRNRLVSMGLTAPAGLVNMYLYEPSEYVAAAIVAVNTRGE